MAVEESVLNKESIKKIMIEQYGILVEVIKKIDRGSANLFEMYSKGNRYILKEFQSKIDIDKVKIEYIVVEHLRRDGISTPNYILNKNGELFFEFNQKLLIVQKFIEGQVVASNTSSKEQIIESVSVYGKIIKSLENFKYELPDFKRHYMSKELCEQDIKCIGQLMKINKNKDVNDALLHKREILLKLKELDYTWQNKLTYKKSHGDYTVFQFIYNDEGNIKAIVDCVSARKIPVARELIRNYFFMAKEIKKENVDFSIFLEYIKEFEKYQKLNYYDLKYMPLLYLIELSRTIYGYEQYIHNNSVEYLDFGNELYNQCLCIEKNSDELSRELLKLKNVNKMKGMKKYELF